MLSCFEESLPPYGSITVSDYYKAHSQTICGLYFSLTINPQYSNIRGNDDRHNWKANTIPR